MDAAAIAFVLGQGCVEGVRRIETPSVGTLLRRAGGVGANWTRRVLQRLRRRRGDGLLAAAGAQR
jgi:hypothetical protein